MCLLSVFRRGGAVNSGPLTGLYVVMMMQHVHHPLIMISEASHNNYQTMECNTGAAVHDNGLNEDLSIDRLRREVNVTGGKASKNGVGNI